MSPSVLHLDDIQSFDKGHRQGHWSRHCCPFCGSSKSIDATHRSLSLDPRTGYYKCFRCDSKGRLGDFVQLKDIDWQKIHKERDEDYKRKQRAVSQFLSTIEPCEGSAAANYLTSRGIETRLASESGCGFHPSYLGRPAIIFPIHDSSGKICAIQGRYIDGKDDPKTKTLGNNKAGVFETPGAFSMPSIFVAESPLDALSLHLMGYPAVSTQGTTLSDRIIEECQTTNFDQYGRPIERIVYVCTDNDDAGNIAADKWRNQLLKAGVESRRFKPERPGWDWNDQLLATL